MQHSAQETTSKKDIIQYPTSCNELWIPYIPENYSIDDIHDIIENKHKIGEIKRIKVMESDINGSYNQSAKITLTNWSKNGYATWIKQMILENGLFKINDGDTLFELMILNSEPDIQFDEYKEFEQSQLKKKDEQIELLQKKIIELKGIIEIACENITFCKNLVDSAL